MSERPGGTGVQVIPLRGTGPLLPIVKGDGSARAVIWPGTGAAMRSIHLIQLAPSSETVLLEHPGESVYYVLDGTGTVAGDGPSPATALLLGRWFTWDPQPHIASSAAPAGWRSLAGHAQTTQPATARRTAPTTRRKVRTARPMARTAGGLARPAAQAAPRFRCSTKTGQR